MIAWAGLGVVSDEAICGVNSNTIWVPDNHTSIQTAINAAVDGDSIYVRAGLYIENVVVNKSVSLFGESRESVIDGGKVENVVKIIADNVEISGFTIKNSNLNGVYALECTNVTITNNDLTGNAIGILFEVSSSNTIEENNIAANNYGIALYESWNNNILRNEVAKNVYYGIELFASSNNTLRNNNITNSKHNFSVQGRAISSFINDIDASNTVNGKSICYLTNQQNLTINPSAFPNIGYLALINSTNVTIENLNLTTKEQGLLLAFTTNSTMTHNNIAINEDGISLLFSNYNTIKENRITTEKSYGITLDSSSNNILSHNVIENNHYGVDLLSSSNNNIISENNITNNDDGVHLYSFTKNNTIFRNNIENSDRGIWFRFSSNNNILGNIIARNYYGMEFDFSFDITVSGNSITNNGPYGIWFRFCSNNSVCGNSVTENQQEGISLYNSSNIAIFGNNITNNNKGIGLVWSFNNVVSENNLITNNCDIEFYESSSNKLYHNNLITNTQQSCISTSGYANSWDNGVEGNYWSDYTGIDTNKDGIGDAPYAIDTENRDNYPLMNPYLPGDCDHDGIVNIKDATKIGIAWNITKGMPNYNPHADLNMDETINTADAEITRKNWQKTSKPP